MGPDRVFRARVRDRGARPAVAVLAVAFAAVVGIGLLPADGDGEWSGPPSIEISPPQSC